MGFELSVKSLSAKNDDVCYCTIDLPDPQASDQEKMSQACTFRSAAAYFPANI